MADFFQLALNGILLGGFYALLGIGMTMIFGIVGLTNLAHGEFVILGAYASSILATALGVEPILTLAVTVPLMFLAGWGIQKLLINRVIDKGSEPALLVTFGLSIILQDVFLLLFSADAQHIFASYSLRTWNFAGLSVSVLNVILFAISIVCLGLFALFLNKSYTGRAIRAVSDDPEAARLSGINVRRIYAVAMGLAMATAAVSGLCVGLKWTFHPSAGGDYLLISFIVVVIGGMGSVSGTLLAGLLFGLVQVFGGASYGMLISYIMLLIMLTFRPGGLRGREGGRA